MLSSLSIENKEKMSTIHIEEFIKPPICIDENMLNRDVISLFKRRNEECAVILHGHHMSGFIMKEKFYQILIGSQYGHFLFANKPIKQVMDVQPVIVDEYDPIPHIIEQAMNREERDRYDCILVKDKSILKGYVTMSDILHMSKILQKEAIEHQVENMSYARKLVQGIQLSVKEVETSSRLGRDESDNMINLTLDGKKNLDQILHTLKNFNTVAEKQEEKMLSLSQNTRVVSKIISTIEEVSNKINLLSLNASIEAARAGEHGKGFSVVASEVKSLASHTKNSLQEISKSLLAISNTIAETVVTVDQSRKEALASQKEVESMQLVIKSLFESITLSKNHISSNYNNAQKTFLLTTETNESLEKLITQIEQK